MKQLFTLLFASVLFINQLLAQSVTISPTGTSALIETKSTTNGLLLPVMKMTQRDAIASTPGLVVHCSDCSPVGPYTYDGTRWKAMFNVGAGTSTVFSVGQQAQGGTIIWVDDTGLHGLVAAPEDIPRPVDGIPWAPFGSAYNFYALAMGSGVLDGAENTRTIVSQFGWNTYAAFLCRQMNYNGYGGWYLPSVKELKYIAAHKDLLTGLDGTLYWSSTEASTDSAYLVNVLNGGEGGGIPQTKIYAGYYGLPLCVRAVRSF